MSARLGALVVVVGLSASALGQCPTFFGAPTVYAAGTRNRGVAAGDLNNDGRLDLVVANRTSSTLSIFLGNPAPNLGTFAPAVNITQPSGPDTVAIGDLNNDGNADLAVANLTGGNISVRFGNGNGTFQAPVNYLAGSQPLSIAIGDLNLDTRPDLVVANNGSANVSVLLQSTTPGVFLTAVQYATGSQPFRVVLADVNNDVRLDILTPNFNAGNVSVLIAQGAGLFAPAVNYATLGVNPIGLAVGDYTGDGRPDLAVANFAGSGPTSVSLLAGNPLPNLGTFGAASLLGAPGTLVGSHDIAMADFDSDGLRDLLVANVGFSNIRLFRGAGGGAFPQQHAWAAEGAPVAIAVADLNNDGRPDAAVCHDASNNLLVYLNRGRCRPDLTTGAVAGQPGYGEANCVLNNDDFFYYLSQFAAANIAVADLTNSAIPGSAGYGVPNGILNNDDFFYYLSLFAAGC